MPQSLLIFRLEAEDEVALLDGGEAGLGGGGGDEGFVLPGIGFGENIAARSEVGGECAEKAAVEIEAVGAAEKGDSGLFFDFGHEVGVVGQVGEVADYRSELAGDTLPEVGLEEGDVGVVLYGIAAGDGQFFFGHIGGGNDEVGAMDFDGNGNIAAAGAEVDEGGVLGCILDGPIN